MKKRCTNNKCRKYFVVKSDTYSCPYCEKSYPRLNDTAASKKLCENQNLQKYKFNTNTYASKKNKVLDSKIIPSGVLLLDHVDNKVKLILATKKWTGKGLAEAKDIIDSLPAVIETKDVFFNHLNTEMNLGTRELIIPKYSPIEGFIQELKKIGCRYKLLY